MGSSHTNYKVLFATIMTSASTEPGMTEPEFVIAPKRLHSRSQFPATAFDFASPKEKLPLFPHFSLISRNVPVCFSLQIYTHLTRMSLCPRKSSPNAKKGVKNYAGKLQNIRLDSWFGETTKCLLC